MVIFARVDWLARKWLAHVLITFEQQKKIKMAFVCILSQIKLLFAPLVIQLVWNILKRLFTSLLVKAVDICLHLGELLLTTDSHHSTLVRTTFDKLHIRQLS